MPKPRTILVGPKPYKPFHSPLTTPELESIPFPESDIKPVENKAEKELEIDVIEEHHHIESFSSTKTERRKMLKRNLPLSKPSQSSTTCPKYQPSRQSRLNQKSISSETPEINEKSLPKISTQIRPVPKVRTLRSSPSPSLVEKRHQFSDVKSKSSVEFSKRTRLSTLSLHTQSLDEEASKIEKDKSLNEEDQPLQRRNSIHNVPFVDVNDPDTRERMWKVQRGEEITFESQVQSWRLRNKEGRDFCQSNIIHSEEKAWFLDPQDHFEKNECGFESDYEEDITWTHLQTCSGGVH